MRRKTSDANSRRYPYFLFLLLSLLVSSVRKTKKNSASKYLLFFSCYESSRILLIVDHLWIHEYFDIFSLFYSFIFEQLKMNESKSKIRKFFSDVLFSSLFSIFARFFLKHRSEIESHEKRPFHLLLFLFYLLIFRFDLKQMIEREMTSIFSLFFLLVSLYFSSIGKQFEWL